MRKIQLGLINSNKDLLDLDNCVINWETFIVSHGLLRLCVVIEEESFFLHFTNVVYIDCAVTMNFCTVRIKEKPELKLPEKLYAYATGLIEQSKLFIFDCNEGSFQLLASNAWIVSEEDKEMEQYFIGILQSPLWKEGPVISEL